MEAFEQYRPLMFSIAYRMLGSVMEAEDILQDAYLRYQAVPPARVESPKAYLSTIVTRLCLNHLQSARVQRETYLGPWLPEPVLSANHPELVNPAKQVRRYESISMAFLVLLEKLTPAERAVFLLRDVFDYEYSEIAHILDKSEVACRKLLSRARKHVSDSQPRFEATAEEHREMLQHFVDAIEEGDLESLTELLAEEVTFWGDGGGKVRGAAARPLHGRRLVARFLLNVIRFAPTGFHYEVLDVNGRAAVVIRGPEGAPFTVITVEVGDGRIRQIHAVANPDKLKHL